MHGELPKPAIVATPARTGRRRRLIIIGIALIAVAGALY
jgi:hypothetical protein